MAPIKTHKCAYFAAMIAACGVTRAAAYANGLAFVAAYNNSVSGFHDLDFAIGVAISPDGANLYVAASNTGSHKIVTFQRNSAFGRLTEGGVQLNVEGLAPAVDVTVSADGKNVYATGSQAIVVFQRDLMTGALSFLESKRQGVDGVYGHVAVAQGCCYQPFAVRRSQCEHRHGALHLRWIGSRAARRAGRPALRQPLPEETVLGSASRVVEVYRRRTHAGWSISGAPSAGLV